MNKYLGIVFWSMLLVAGVLGFMATDQLENRLENMQMQIDEINIMLNDMRKE
tara:strand:- start:586 stop:741 length:156 start_codon:yes stop_codon:yes gene_type:complete